VPQSQWPEYAVKIIDNAVVEAQNCQENVAAELTMLRLLRHPNVIGFVAAFTFDRNFYILTESSTFPVPYFLAMLISVSGMRLRATFTIGFTNWDRCLKRRAASFLQRSSSPSNMYRVPHFPESALD